MKKIVFLFLLLAAKSVFAQEALLEKARDNYFLAASNENICHEMISKLKNHKENPLKLGYLGAYEIIRAKHIFNPLKKYKTFQKGREKLEKAIAANTQNLELRFLRLSLQLNLPGILGYKSKVEKDKDFIMANMDAIRDEQLEKMVKELPCFAKKTT